jgi:predicted nuclease with TOPRIM domain
MSEPIKTRLSEFIDAIRIDPEEMKEIYESDSRIGALLRRREKWERQLETYKSHCKEQADVFRERLKAVNAQIAGLRNRQRGLNNTINITETKWMSSAIIQRIRTINGQIASRKFKLNKEKARRIAVQVAKASIARISMKDVNSKLPSGNQPDPAVPTTAGESNETGQERIG